MASPSVTTSLSPKAASKPLLDRVVIELCDQVFRKVQLYSRQQITLEECSQSLQAIQGSLQSIGYQFRIPTVPEGLTIIVEKTGPRLALSTLATFCSSCCQTATRICCNQQLCPKCFENHRKEKHQL